MQNEDHNYNSQMGVCVCVYMCVWRGVGRCVCVWRGVEVRAAVLARSSLRKTESKVTALKG